MTNSALVNKMLLYCLFITLWGCKRDVPASPTPLVNAILKHDSSAVRILLDSGANVNELSGAGGEANGHAYFVCSPLSCAAEQVNDTEIMELLIKHGGDPNLPLGLITTGFNPICSAIFKGRILSTEFLLEHGARVDSIDTSPSSGGRTPLLYAITSRDNLTYGAMERRVSEQNRITMTDLRRDVDMSNFGDTSLFHHLSVYDSIISTLFRFGASVNKPDVRGETPLHYAADYCDSTLAEALTARGASLTAKDNDGETPEDIARKNCPSVLTIIEKRKNLGK